MLNTGSQLTVAGWKTQIQFLMLNAKCLMKRLKAKRLSRKHEGTKTRKKIVIKTLFASKLAPTCTGSRWRTVFWRGHGGRGLRRVRAEFLLVVAAWILPS